MEKDLLENIEKEASKRIDGVASIAGLETIRVKYLGRSGELTKVLRSLHKYSENERKIIGKEANELKVKLEKAIEDKNNLFKSGEVRGKVEGEWVDVTEPGKKINIGHLHPVTLLIEELNEIFKSMGYEIADGPEVEDDYHNFESLNMPKEHPARDAWDTFYLNEGFVMRTHTSPVQIRVMENRKPPLKVIAPGRVYRYEPEDSTHLSVFNQLEGLVIDENISFSDLKGTLNVVMKSLLGKDIKLRFRPSYFPFTEPSAEVDISCIMCKGKGCRSCGGDGWLEMLGAGMVHPKVLRNVGYDSEKYSGFAFGLGVERIAMFKYRIDDIREFMKGDLRFLNQF